MDDDQTMPLKPGQLLPPQPEGLLNLGFRSAVTEGKSPDSDEPAVLQRHLPQYRVRDIIGRGGMGNVLRVDDPKLARAVALKTMKLGLAATEEERGRFVREATVLARLAHPNIVPIYDLGADGAGSPFYTMKLVKGCTLAAILKDLRNGVPDAVAQHSPDRLLGVFRKVCDAIAFAHSRDVLHRDLKPENIMVGEFGEVLVMDWGLAKLLRGEEEAGSVGGLSQSLVVRSRASLGPSTLGATLDGSLMGTPQYMAPEQARGEVETLDARADIYALGAILYHILALRPPVEGKNVQEVLAKVARGEAGCNVTRAFQPVTLSTPAGKPVSPSLLAVVRKAMALDKADRYQSVSDLQREIEAYQSGFATDAEKAGLGKQFLLAVKRNKAASIGLASVLLITIGFTAKVVAEGRRAERGEAKANAALADLKKSAPALLQLAESEAGFQRFDSAIVKLDAALTLDPSLDEAYWQRAWCLLGQEKWNEASAALRSAGQQNPARNERAGILPVVERIASAIGAGGAPSGTDALALVQHLESVGATGAATRLGVQFKTGRKELERLCRKRIADWVGQEAATKSGIGEKGFLWAKLEGLPINTLAPLRGLPLEGIDFTATLVADLEPLRGMGLRELRAVHVPISDLRPLAGMPLEVLILRQTKVRDLGPLQGMPLRELNVNLSSAVEDLSPLRGLPLSNLDLSYTAVRDLSPISGMKLAELSVDVTQIDELSALRGMPLTALHIRNTKVRDLMPLRGAPIQELDMANNDRFHDLTPLLDLPQLLKLRVSRLGKRLEPLRAHPSLKQIAYEEEPYRPVAEFWADYDAKQAAGKK